jgi:hypothetical protein
MKVTRLLLLAALGLPPAAMAAEPHAHAHGPMHGGVHAEVRDLDFELVARPGVLQLYVSDHGKPIEHAKASARLVLLAGADKQEIDLKPGPGRFEAKGSFRTVAGTKAVAQVTIDGRLTTVRFVLK